MATLTLQEAVIRFGGRPSWSRLGTHHDLSKFQKPNGEPYLSGTEYEYEETVNAEKPQVLLAGHRQLDGCGREKVEAGDRSDGQAAAPAPVTAAQTSKALARAARYWSAVT